MTDAAPQSDARPTRPRLLRNPFFWGAIAGIILVPAIRPLTRHVPAPPPVDGTMPAFALRDQHDRPLRSSDLIDHVYLASFVSARCDGACEARLVALEGLQARCRTMGVKLRLLSFTLDPEHDSPNDLLALAQRHTTLHADESDHRWVLVTGEPNAVKQLLEAGVWPTVRRAMAKQARSSALADWSVLVDGEGGVRGAYLTDADGLYEVFHRAQHVMSLRRQWR